MDFMQTMRPRLPVPRGPFFSIGPASGDRHAIYALPRSSVTASA